jgi:hypothetical protein
MQAILNFFTPARRKWLYSVSAAVNSALAVVLPILVANGVIENTVAGQVLQISASVISVVSALLAFKNVAPAESEGV